MTDNKARVLAELIDESKTETTVDARLAGGHVERYRMGKHFVSRMGCVVNGKFREGECPLMVTTVWTEHLTAAWQLAAQYFEKKAEEAKKVEPAPQLSNSSPADFHHMIHSCRPQSHRRIA